VIAVDTNVLVRVLVDDPGQRAQVAAARSQVKRAGQVWVAQIVQAETVRVLESAYGPDRTTILRVLEHLRSNQAYVLQNEEAFASALGELREGRADFADYLILAECRTAGHPLVTFDKRLREAPGTRPVTAER
jgi:predicted nucleic-acid-binding protein